MAPTTSRFSAWNRIQRSLLAVWCAILLLSGQGVLLAQEKAAAPQPSPAAAGTADTAEPPAERLPPEQLDALVAPIALYPDPLLAQTLVASTYPLEIIQLHQWMTKNQNLKDKALADAVAKQPWDPSIQSMAAVPEVVKRLADDLQWTTDLGNAFLGQQSDVMEAVQRMRKKAKEKGALESNEKQKVEAKVVEEKTVIVVQSASPEVIYVPTYSPVVVYGPPVYPYPPIYYPPYPPGAAFVTFSFGVMMGAAIWGGSCCGCGWGHSNNVNINVNNNFNKNHISTGNRPGGGGGGNWQHNPQHRGAAPYSNKATANKYGGSAKGQSPSSRQAGTRQQPSAGTSNRGGGGPSASNRASGGTGSAGAKGPSTMGGGSSRGGGDQIGNRSVPKSSGSKAGGFGGGSGGYSGSSARASSSRGSSSMGSRGGGSRGGGGRRR